MTTITDAKLTLKTETCPLCQGWGELEGYAGVNKMTCFKCKGTGREKIYQLTAQQGVHIMKNKDIEHIILNYCEGFEHLEFNYSDLHEM